MHTRWRETLLGPRTPRTYQMDRKTSPVVIRIAMFVFGFFLLVTMADLTGVVKHPPPRVLSLLGNGAFLLLLAAVFHGRDGKVILYEDGIEAHAWSSRRELRRDEIPGWRFVTGYRGISR